MSDIVNTLKDKNWILYGVDSDSAYFRHKKTGADIWVHYPKWLLPLIESNRNQSKELLQSGIRELLGLTEIRDVPTEGNETS
jgi:hypothetical protein